MDGHNRFHRRFLNKRQGLGGILSGILGDGPSSVSPSGTTTDPTSGLGGIVGGLTSLVGGLSTALLPSSGPSSVRTSSTSLTPSSSSTGSTTTLTLTSTTSKMTSISSTTSSSTRTSSLPTSTPTPTPTSSEVVYTSTQGLNIVYITSVLPPDASTAAAPKSFLQNPSEEGPVFAIVGIAVVILIFILATWTMRTRRRDRLERDLAAAVSFEPTVTDHYDDDRESSIEKPRLSGSSSGHGHGYGYGIQPAYGAPQHAYYGPTGHGAYSTHTAYRAPSPNPVPYPVPSPAAPAPAAQGGANLQRKFSDRKPVPPLLPNPAYDPSATQVSLPEPFYQQ